MVEEKYKNFIGYLDTYSINEPFLKGEYEILRQSIRDNYNKLNLHNIPEINCNYESVTNNCIKPFYSLHLIQKG